MKRCKGKDDEKCNEYPLFGEDFCVEHYDGFDPITVENAPPPVAEVFELIANLTVDQLSILCSVIENEFYLKAHYPTRQQARRVPTLRWLDAGQRRKGCDLYHITDPEERAIRHIRNECKSRECKLGYERINYG